MEALAQHLGRAMACKGGEWGDLRMRAGKFEGKIFCGGCEMQERVFLWRKAAARSHQVPKCFTHTLFAIFRDHTHTY
jgi:hypothetical protein